MRDTYELKFTATQWDVIADSLCDSWLNAQSDTEAIRVCKILAIMHRDRPNTKSRQRATRLMGQHVLYGAIRLPWDHDGEFEQRKGRMKAIAKAIA